ncbi:MAG: TetR/AcrR family transcriptional regulator [Deltaproteobacteria bacterium]|nr:TetR/AcrR family transcriptional regulator [Deltaproteobacteria bacterium]MBW1847316.1 TetR/AcrR family transcriptional regulator [Deltaproteobacteria bacterium]MBW2363739.1 TetR/AcrR family transcriptional regulator [Deltaproteobacteria bacterium]
MPPIPELEAIRKAQILEASLTTIAASGCANVTMADICRAAGLSKGGLAHYYKSKRDLFLAAFEEFFKRIFLRGKETMAQVSDPLDKLLSFQWLYNKEDPDAYLGYPVLFDFMSIAVHDDEYRLIFHDWVSNWLTILKEAINEGITSGHFKNIDPETAAKGISAIYQGIATRWFLAPELHSTEWALDTLKRAVTGLLDSYQQQT